MAYRNGNYSAFYVEEPFNENNLGANSTKDFVYYNLLRAWKGADSSFPFIDSHDKNYGSSHKCVHDSAPAGRPRRGKRVRMRSCQLTSGEVVCRSVDGRLRGPRF